MTGTTKILTAGAIAAGILYAISRTERGQEVTVDALERVIETGHALVRWVLPDAGKPYVQFFDAASLKYGIPPGLLARQAYQESRFRNDIITGRVRSSAGAVGIMQIIPKWHPEIDAGDAAADERAALDPPRAIDYAAKFLRNLYRTFGSWSLALAAYNAGAANVQKYGGVPPFPETQKYVADITRDVGVA